MALLKSITLNTVLLTTIFLSTGAANAAGNMTGAQAASTLNRLIQQNSGGSGKSGDVQSSCTLHSNPNGCDDFIRTCEKHNGGLSKEPGGYGCHVVRPSTANPKNTLKALN